MPFSLAAAREDAGFSSNTELATKVLELWKQRDGNARYKLNALATLVGRIEQQPVWWRKRPHAAAALAEALCIDVAELPLGVPTRRGRDRALFVFEDLPELRPLDLAVEAPCQAAAPDWWTPERLFFSERTWVVAPAGAGRSLLGRWCEARGRCRLLTVPRLEDAAEAALAEKQHALFIDVLAPDTDTDARAADALLACSQSVLVAASFGVVAGQAGRERAVAEARKARSLFGQQRGGNGQVDEGTEVARLWGLREWQPPSDWRSRFTSWVAERLEQASPAKVQEVVAWLEMTDPDASLWRTPGDLLPLLGWAFLEGSLRRLRREDLVKAWIKGRIQRAATDGSERSAWLHSTAARAMDSLVSRRLADIGRAWDVPMPLEKWAELVPPDLAPRAATDGLARRIEQVAALPKKADRAREARQVEIETTRSTARVAVQHLVAARLLRAAPGGGGYVIHPRWVAAWWAAERAAAAIREESPAMWGRMAMEKTRRALFDDALDALDDRAAARLIDATLKAFHVEDFGSAAAIEAVFAATARRLERGGVVDARRLHALWARQQQLLVRRVDWRPMEPLTRMSVHDGADEADWICNMWSFSLRVPRPALPMPPDYEWLLPGWCEPKLAELPQWIGSRLSGHFAPRHFYQRLHQLVWEILPRCPDQAFPRAKNGFDYSEIAGPLVLLADERGWALPDDFVSGMLQYWSDDGRRACQFLSQLGREDQQRLAVRLFQQASVTKDGDWLITRLHREHRHWWDWMAEHIPDEVVETLAHRGIISDESLRYPETWPPRLWLAAARGVIAAGNVDKLVELLSGRDGQRKWTAAVVPLADALLQPLRKENWKLAQLIELLWEHDPELAMQRVREKYPQDEAAERWFNRGEEKHLGFLLSTIEELGVGPAWVAPWLARQLPRAGADAERAYRLLRRALSASPQ